MDIIRGIKDIILLTPYLIALGIGVIMNTLIYFHKLMKKIKQKKMQLWKFT